MLRYLLLFVIMNCFITGLSAQVIWQEDFSGYTDGTTTGANNNTTNPANDWTAVCPGSIAASDYFYVVGGQLQGRDTNGPATFETEVIDISSCNGEVSYSIDFSELGALEGCVSGCGCNCVDWVQLEVSLDGGAYTAVTSPQGGPCTQGCSGGDYLLLGEFGSFSYTSPCMIGSSLQLRISVQTWAGTEYINVNNIVVECGAGSCVLLPVEMEGFNGNVQDNGHLLHWITTSEINNNYFELERSVDGVTFQSLAKLQAAGNATTNHEYQYLDAQPLLGHNYYRLKMVDFDGAAHYSSLVALENERVQLQAIQLYPNPVGPQATLQLAAPLQADARLQVIDMLGRVIRSRPLQGGMQRWSLESATLEAGTYMLQIETENGLLYQRQFIK